MTSTVFASVVLISLMVLWLFAFSGLRKEAFTSGPAADAMTFRNPNVEVKRSTMAGRGVFAVRNFAKGDVIETAPSIIDKCSNFTGTLGDYVTSTDDPDKCAIHLGYFNFYNHDDRHNATYAVDTDTRSVEVSALKSIKKGQEIFVHYGDEYWEGRAGNIRKLRKSARRL